MDKLSSKITGDDYFSAYRSRLVTNDEWFKKLMVELVALGCTVYHNGNNSKYISFIYVEKENKALFNGFAEVPYRWYLHGDNSLSRNPKERFDYDQPFTAPEILLNLRDKTKQIVEPEKYLQKFTA